MRFRSAFASACLCTPLAAALATPAAAQGASPQPERIAGRVLLGAELEPISIISDSTTYDGGPIHHVSATTSRIGITPGLAANLGYAVSPLLVLGARLAVMSADTTFSPSTIHSNSNTDLSLWPYASFVFGSGSTRFFVDATLGVIHSSRDVANQSSSATAWALGTRAGLHCFIADRVSIDPAFLLFYRSTSGSVPDTSTPTPESVDYTSSSVVGAVQLGLTVWLGGSSQAAAPESDSEPADEATRLKGRYIPLHQLEVSAPQPGPAAPAQTPTAPPSSTPASPAAPAPTLDAQGAAWPAPASPPPSAASAPAP